MNTKTRLFITAITTIITIIIFVDPWPLKKEKHEENETEGTV
jgi:hypothetical protein